MRKLIVKAVLFIIIVSLSFALAKGINSDFNKDKSRISASQWLREQEYYIETLARYSQNLDTIVSVYVIGGCTEEAFIEYIRQSEIQLRLIKLEYEDFKKAHPVRYGTETPEAAKGEKAIKNLFDTYQKIIDMCREASGSTELLAYNYLAYHDVLVEHVADYSVAVTVLNLKEGAYEEILSHVATPGDAEKAAE